MSAVISHSPPPFPLAAAWSVLRAELDCWAAERRAVTFWWRDDDAVSVTPALEQLRDLARSAGVPVALAVIPAAAEPELAAFLEDWPEAAAIQHGWAHTNHAGPAEKKCELGTARPADAVLGELAAGRRRMEALFGGRFLPVLTPPWNRIAPAVAERLAETGLRALSTFAPRRGAYGRLTQVNTHVDPVDWRRGGGFAGDAAALAAAVAHLGARRIGTADPDEPTGLLTHHRTMDAATRDFVARFVAETAAHPAGRWLSPVAVFGAPA
ncbi:polysaccharide deacetylase family protein [Azospirillum halopraeferens]|uniref:polysaccharide deacetylase family protein n=1 Tax=Azospirillum halopraeferens TaxID=34010 RepID=UPI0004269EC4|nr:polysaccharide deacetylase family protein [Azospirillum halopraeferens]